MTVNKKYIIFQVIVGLVIMLFVSGCDTNNKDSIYKDTYQKVREIIDNSKKIEAEILDGKTYTGKDIANLWEEVNTKIIGPTSQLSQTRDSALNEVVSMLSARSEEYLTKYYADSRSQLTANTAMYEKSITLQPIPDTTDLLNIRDLSRTLHSYTFITVPPSTVN